MIEAYKKMWTNYANFNGRTSRRDYWLAVAMNLIISSAISIITTLTGIKSLNYVSYIYSLAVLIPGIAMAVRRLHDVNKPGTYYFMGLIPLAGPIIILIKLCSDSVNENNNY